MFFYHVQYSLYNEQQKNLYLKVKGRFMYKKYLRTYVQLMDVPEIERERERLMAFTVQEKNNLMIKYKAAKAHKILHKH